MSGDAARRGPVIVDARVAAGHDGRAELVLRLRFENGGSGTVTLPEHLAGTLLERCGADSLEALRGRSGELILGLMERAGDVAGE